MILGYIISGLYIICVQWLLRRWIMQMILFKRDEYNPFRRKCRRCGQWQSMYDNGGTSGLDYRSWWEEIYPLGNNPKCKCKKYCQ